MKTGTKPPVAEGAAMRALRQFWAGFTDLSALSLAVCAATLAVSCLFAAWFFQPRTMAGPLGDYMARSAVDADAFALVEAVRMAASPPTEPTMVFLGSSAVAQMVGNGRRLETELAGLPSGPWDVRVLTTPLQSPLDQLRLLETALKGRDAGSPPLLVAIGTGLTRLGWTGERLLDRTVASRIPLRSDWADAELAALDAPVPARWPVWAIEHADFVIQNGTESLTRLALQRPARRVVDAYARGKVDDRGTDAILRNIAVGLTSKDQFFEQQARIAARVLAAPNTHVVFVEEPLAPGFIAEHGLAPALAAFRADAAVMAARAGGAFWPVIRDSGLTQSHYFDHLHLLPGEAQQLCMERIASRLAAADYGTPGQ